MVYSSFFISLLVFCHLLFFSCRGESCGWCGKRGIDDVCMYIQMKAKIIDISYILYIYTLHCRSNKCEIGFFMCIQQEILHHISSQSSQTTCSLTLFLTIEGAMTPNRTFRMTQSLHKDDFRLDHWIMVDRGWDLHTDFSRRDHIFSRLIDNEYINLIGNVDNTDFERVRATPCHWTMAVAFSRNQSMVYLQEILKSLFGLRKILLLCRTFFRRK
jgi:hypothetical protein